MGSVWRWLTDPHIGDRLLREEDEDIVDVVHKHWIVYVVPALFGFAGLICWILVPFSSVRLGWAPILIGLALMLWGGFRALQRNIDRFVVTNQRVFRVHGLLNRKEATMPLSRILDITVDKPIQGRILSYGHFTFESAAQAQGLREIHYVGHPDERNLTIQRVVQRAGLRGRNPQQVPKESEV
jgi:membrane protein YdbS with pleckstrin-like domain